MTIDSTPAPQRQAPLQFGVFLPPQASSLAAAIELATAADTSGLDFIAVQDHPYQPEHLDSFTLLGHLLARTHTVRAFPDVANLLLRPPAMLAKQAATLDRLSGGRFELGLGAGASVEAARGMGIRARYGTAVSVLEEAIGVLRAAWASKPMRHHGVEYDLPGYTPGPEPRHRISIWLGVHGPRMLELAGRVGDGWIPSYPFLAPEAVPAALARIEAGAAEAGRDPRELRRIYNVPGTIRPRGAVRRRLDGPAEHWVEVLSEWALELGFDTFILVPANAQVEQVLRFGHDIAPAVRARVSSAAGGASPARLERLI